jgi:hypothetical protein
MTRNFRRLAVGALAALALSATACEPTAVKYGKLDLMLTDAPGDVVTAMVTIDRIYLQSGDDTGEESGRIILRDEDVTVDLLTLSDATMDLIVGAEIPVGTYKQLRFVISGGYLEIEGEAENAIYASSPEYSGLPLGATVTGSLQMPSFASSGLKVTLPGDAVVIQEDETLTLVVDFDVALSFGQATGGGTGWVMHPVIHAAPPPAPAP